MQSRLLATLFWDESNSKGNKNSGKGKQKHEETGRGRSSRGGSSRGRRWCGRSPICSSRCTCSLRCPPLTVSRTRRGLDKKRGHWTRFLLDQQNPMSWGKKGLEKRQGQGPFGICSIHLLTLMVSGELFSNKKPS